MNILIDSSVWIDYFRGGSESENLELFISQNVVCTNDLILAELIPFLMQKKEQKLIKLLKEITKIPLDINWQNIVNYQYKCIRNGINKIGIPDLIIVDNVIRNDIVLYSLDKDFKLINSIIPFEMM